MDIKILQICDVYPPSFSGYGKQLFTINKRLEMDFTNVQLLVLTTYDRNSAMMSRGNQLVVSLFRHGRMSYSFRTLRYFVFCLSLFFLWSQKFRKADVVHVVKASYEFMVAFHLARYFKKPIVVKVVQSEIYLTKKSFVKNIFFKYKLKLLKSDNCYSIAISDDIYRQLCRLGVSKSNIFRAPNAVDVNRFSPDQKYLSLRREFNVGYGDVKNFILYCGSISQRKGVNDLLAALENLTFDKKTCVLFLGPSYGEISGFDFRLQELSKRNDLVAVYLGNIEKPEPYFAIADLLVLPSYAEGMPNVALEAMASGLPLLLSDIPVHVELIEHGTGKTFRLGDPFDLAQKLNDIIYDVDLRKEYGLNGVEAAHSIYAVESVAQKYYELYCSLNYSGNVSS